MAHADAVAKRGKNSGKIRSRKAAEDDDEVHAVGTSDSLRSKRITWQDTVLPRHDASIGDLGYLSPTQFPHRKR